MPRPSVLLEASKGGALSGTCVFTTRKATPLGCPFFCCKDPDLVALLKLGLLTTPRHLLRLLDLLSSHV